MKQKNIKLLNKEIFIILDYIIDYITFEVKVKITNWNN